MRVLDAAAVLRLGHRGAIDAITAALRDGLDPAAGPARTAVPTAHGELLLMPAEAVAAAGVKVVGVAPGNPALGLPRIDAVHLQLDAATLRVRAVLDGTALTALRTPAVSVAAVLPVLPRRPLRVVVIGTGPQARGHAAALAAVRPIAHLAHLARGPREDAERLGSPAGDALLAAADVIVCATSARTPLFDPALPGDEAVVIAIGSHEPGARELDASLPARATVVVEDPATALREAGDVVLAIAEGVLSADDLVPMRDLVTGRAAVVPGRPVVFKGVGMAWQDVVVAEAVLALPG